MLQALPFPIIKYEVGSAISAAKTECAIQRGQEECIPVRVEFLNGEQQLLLLLVIKSGDVMAKEMEGDCR